MISTPFNRLLIAHLQSSWSPSLKINQINWIVANPTLSAYIIDSHSTKDYDKTIFVKNSRMITSCRWNSKLLHPSVRIKWKNLCNTKWSTAMTSNYDYHVFIACSCMTFSWFWLPALEFILRRRDCVFYIFCYSVYYWFFNDLTYLGIQCGQSFLFIIVDVEYLLIFQWFFYVLIELWFSGIRKLGFDTCEGIFVLF